MPIKYIGRPTNTKGKPLWEILGNLKNFGVGRMVIRHNLQRYPEPSFMRILKVAALPDTTVTPHDARKVIALVEKTFRGVKVPKLVQIDSTSYKADYMLVPKDEESRYLKNVQHEIKILPRTIEFPPLLQEILTKEAKQKGINEVPKLTMQYNFTGIKSFRVAEEGETPTVNFVMGLGIPKCPRLYENIKYDDES